jgi:3-isopropylmalate/(R)-2-methylmalate dehydratase small subunit
VSLRGRALVFGDDISTDQITPGKYLKLTEAEAALHAMEGVDPTFVTRVRPGDLLVAGRNFGAGSSREYAASALRIAGIGAVIAPFFARIFFRNAINQGLAVLECADAGRIREGDELEVDVVAGEVRDLTQGFVLTATKLPPHILELIAAGGIVPWLERWLAAKRSA